MNEPPAAYSHEALLHSIEGKGTGSLLRLSPSWAQASYWVVIGIAAVSMLFVIFARVDEYAVGQAVVRFPSRTVVSSRVDGTVLQVLVQPGQRVQQGAPLIRLDAQPELLELDKLNREFDLQLNRILEDPGNQTTRTELASVRARRELAQTRVDERWVRAPEEGFVGSLRVRAGQYLKLGELVATINGMQARPEVVALIPGQHRPRLQASMRLRLELAGFAYAYQDVSVGDVSEQLVGPTQIAGYLGADAVDTISVAGPLVVVRASLESSSFSAEGRQYAYYDGMLGTATLRLDSRSILLMLVPGLDDLVKFHLGAGASSGVSEAR